MILQVALALLAVSFEASPAPAAADPYAGRNGEAEAFADIARGNPAKIYYHSFCGDRCVFHGAGLANCEPERFDTESAPKGFFVIIPEASFDVRPYSAEELAQRSSAYSFAKAYNLTMFLKRKREILKHCPRAVLQN